MINLLWNILYIILDSIKFEGNMIIVYSTAFAAVAGGLTAFATMLLAYFNYRYLHRIDSQIHDMHAQTSLLREQAAIMQEDFKQRSLERKNKRLTDEMDHLVSKLYSSAESRVKWRPFTPVDPQYTMEDRKREHYLFWEDIKQNIHYTRDDVLQNELKKISIIVDKFSDGKNVADEQKKELEGEFDNLSNGLKGIIGKRYILLLERIKESEKELEAS